MSSSKISTNLNWQVCIVFCLIAALTLAPEAHASTVVAGGIGNVLCTMVTALTGPIGRAVGLIALVVLGMGIFLGKLSWPLALATGLGITFIFSASSIIGWLSAAGGAASSAGTGC